MTINNTNRLAALKRNLELRSRACAGVHAFFQSRGYVHVETPVRLAAPALETHIDAEPSGSMFLRTSPELHMKRMLAAGYGKIYQLGPCFRQGERGERHHPEYTMLEWYCEGMDYTGIMDETRALLKALGVERDWQALTVQDAFVDVAGWDPVASYDAARFETDLVDKVESALPRDKAVVLKDYPAAAAAFARLSPDDPRVAERWELYLDGVELANAYTELTDAAEQRRRFEQSAKERSEMGKPVYPLDEAFLDAMDKGIPECAGIALGFDRLVMVMCGASSLDEVMAFRE